MEVNNIHMGEEVKKVYKELNLSPDAFAKLLGCSRPNVYAIFKNPTIQYEQLKHISEVLDHDFMYLINDDSESSKDTDMVRAKSNKERIPSIVDWGLFTADDKEFANIVRDYVSGEYSKPLVVLAYNCSEVAHEISFKESKRVYGVRVSRNTVDLQSLRYTPHEVYIFSERNASEKGEDVNTYLGKVIEAKSKTSKHLIYIIDIPRYNLDSIEEYTKLENVLQQRYSLWRTYVHAVCLDSTQALTNRRKNLEHGQKLYGFDASIAAHKCRLTDSERQKVADNPCDVVYSVDGKRLLKATSATNVFEVKAGTEVICDEAFGDNTSVTKVILPDSVSSLGREAFACCKALLQVVMPKKMDLIGNACFKDCDKLARVIMPTELKYICEEAFEGCQSLKSIEIPATLSSIGDAAFKNSGLTSVVLCQNDGVVCKLGERVFENCKNLATVTIGSDIDILNAFVFDECNSLTEVSFKGKHQNAGDLIDGLATICPSLERINYIIR